MDEHRRHAPGRVSGVESSTPSSAGDAFYTRLFTENPTWSARHPNVEEARRTAKLLPLLSEVALEHYRSGDGTLRLLDLGCGRGWLTHIASAYGECVGIEPVGPVVEHARALFPDLRFEVGTTTELLGANEAGSFDVVIASEVIEHVPPPQRDRFVEDMRALLRPDGAAIVTSDRGELYARWIRSGATEQPEEDWLTERELRRLFVNHGFRVVRQDRAYYAQRQLSPFHRVIASPRVLTALTAVRQRWLLEGLRYPASECQVWLFRR